MDQKCTRGITSLRYIVFLICVIVLFDGCSRFDAHAVPIPAQVWDDIEYTVLDVNAIEDEELLDWFEKHYREQGVYVFDGKRPLYKYVLITAGEKPTGGYALQIDQMRGSADEIEIKISVTEPQKGDFVTQGFAYPYMIVQIHKDGRKIVLEK